MGGGLNNNDASQEDAHEENEEEKDEFIADANHNNRQAVDARYQQKEVH